jgi:hypothetical protein
MNTDVFVAEQMTRAFTKKQNQDVVDAKQFPNGEALCTHIDRCLLSAATNNRELIVLFQTYETRELLRTRYDCDTYEYLDKPNRARVRGRRLDGNENDARRQ